MKTSKRHWMIAGLLFLGACSSDVTPIEDCTAGHGIEPLCTFNNPEDLVLLADGDSLIVSQAPSPDAADGRLGRLSVLSGEVDVLFPTPDFIDRRDWGDPTCAPPNPGEFAPHGIDLVTRTDGNAMLAVINHGGPETVEFFALGETGALEWRGCVVGHGDAFWNDLVALPDGGFIATQMMPKDGQAWALLKALFGFDTGWAEHWDPGQGFAAVPGTAMPFPNGIERSADGRYLYIGSYAAGELRKIDAGTGSIEGRLEILRPDNLTWSRDGRLLAVGSADSLSETLACGAGVVNAGCGAGFEVVAVDPDTLRGELILAHRGAPFGGASVALEVGDYLYLGAFTGDRIARWRWHPSPP